MAQADRSEVTLFMQTQVLSGSIFISTPDGRLLDELNEDSAIGPYYPNIFSELTDVTIWHADGTEEKVPSVYINKTTVQMAGTSNADSMRGIGAKSDPKAYPFVEKLAVLVSIDISGYSITGNMYRASHQKLEHVLQERALFMPLTDAYIISVVNGRRWHLPFLAVNKMLILSLHDWGMVMVKPLPV